MCWLHSVINMKIENIPIDSLIPYARNSRTHSDNQISQIVDSIREFGFTNPVLISNDCGIIAGHGRVIAARIIGMHDVPCIRLGGMTEVQRRAYVIADNKIALNSGWDVETLRLELHEIGLDDFDVTLTGFTEEEIGDLGTDDPVPIDEVDEIKEECEIKIVCANWSDRESAIARLGSKKIDWLDLEGMLR
jgi:ParB-like chromosome segregation protein Spo0J